MEDIGNFNFLTGSTTLARALCVGVDIDVDVDAIPVVTVEIWGKSLCRGIVLGRALDPCLRVGDSSPLLFARLEAGGGLKGLDTFFRIDNGSTIDSPFGMYP